MKAWRAIRFEYGDVLWLTCERNRLLLGVDDKRDNSD